MKPPLLPAFPCRPLSPLHPQSLKTSSVPSGCYHCVLVLPQEVAAVPTRAQEPVVPPTLVAVSPFLKIFISWRSTLYIRAVLSP